ncbi:sugar porter family MFS transporter [bacterium]|nr:sugar porter family MFS transporter [bacterium]
MNKNYLFNLALIAIAGSFGGLLAGYEMGIISGAQLFIIDEWNLSTQLQGCLVAIVMVGCFIGAFLNGFFADKIGRKKILGILGLVYLIGCICCANAVVINMLIGSRIINGIACGMANSIVPMYLSEISPKKTRGFFASLFQLSFTIGILCSYLIGFIFSSSGNWRAMFLTGAVPAIMLLLLYGLLSESPRWLVLKGREEEAKKVFEKIEEPESINLQIAEIKEAMNEKSSNSKKKIAIEKWMYMPLFVAIGIMFAQICTGINVIICYAPKIFQSAGFNDPSDAMKITIIIGVVNFLMTFVAMYLSDRAGRKPLLLSGAAIMGVSMFVLAVSFIFGESLGDMQKWLAILSIIGFICSFAYSLGPVAWILVSEIFPLEVKGFLMTFPVAANFIFNIVLNALYPIMTETYGIGATFGLFGVICILSIIFIILFVPETKGISLEQIEENWKKGIAPSKF